MNGVDIPINRLVSVFNKGLWPGVGKKEFNGRVSRNIKDENIIPEVLIENTNDYRRVQFNDRLNAMCFFDVGNEVSGIEEVATQEVRLFFAVKMPAIYPFIGYRATNEVHADVINLIKKEGAFTHEITSIQTGPDAFGDLYSENLKQYDMQPWHVFALIMNMTFYHYC